MRGWHAYTIFTDSSISSMVLFVVEDGWIFFPCYPDVWLVYLLARLVGILNSVCLQTDTEATVDIL